ncbi:unnamed protein product [Heterobilharzia americana]|nr:unnamed protein product [Heterobilharzia americana]
MFVTCVKQTVFPSIDSTPRFPQSRLTCPTGNQKPIHSQFIRAGQLSVSSALPGNQINDNFTSHSRSNTPTNAAYSNSTTINSGSLNTTQYANYIPKDGLQQPSLQQQQSQMKISSPQSSPCIAGVDVNLMQLPSNLPNQPGVTMTPQNHRRSHMATNSNMHIHQSVLIAQQQQQQLGPNRSVLWEGEIHVAGPSGMNITSRFSTRLLLEQCAVRDMNSQISMQMWGSVAQLSVIQAYRDSPLVERLSSPLASGQLLARLLVELPDPNDANNLSTLLSPQGNQMMIPLGVLSPSSIRLSNPIQPGIVGFICLIHNPKRNRIHGLVPYDSEQFRQDITTGRYTNIRSNPMTPELSGSQSTGHFQRVPPNSQKFPQGNPENQGAMGNINSQYLNTSHPSSNIPLCDTSPGNTQSTCLNASYQYQNQSHIPQYIPQHTQGQNASKSQTICNNTYQGMQLSQRSTPSPHNIHDSMQTGPCIPSYALESDESTQWVSNRTDSSNHQNPQLSISNNTIPHQSVRTLQSGQNQHMIQQAILQRSGMNTPYTNNGSYPCHPHSRPAVDRLNVPTPMQDQPVVHNSQLTGVLLQGQQQQSQSYFVPSGTRFQGGVGPAPVNSYHRNNVPQIPSQNSMYSQPQAFNQRDHYLTSQPQNHVPPSSNIGGGYTCYPSCNNMSTNSMSNPSGHRFISGPTNVGSMQLPNQPLHIPKHPHPPILSQSENSGSRHGTFNHQSPHTRSGPSNANCNTSLDSLGSTYGIPSQDLTHHMMHTALHGSLRQQPSYDSCGGNGSGSSQGFF